LIHLGVVAFHKEVGERVRSSDPRTGIGVCPQRKENAAVADAKALLKKFILDLLDFW